MGQAVRTALELGHLHIDSESIYGNGAEIGAALQQALNDGVVRRE
jgi:diketogulonate reductase-like aldo/keto reductase